MSTTFGVNIPESEETIEIAFRDNGGRMRWLTQIARILPNDTEVIALDNSAQGIHTVADIRRAINEHGIIWDD